MFLLNIGGNLHICFLLRFILLQQLALHIFQQLIDLHQVIGYIGGCDELGVIVDFHAVAELYSQEDGVLHLVPDVGSSYVVVEAFRVIFYHDFALTLALIFSLYELLLEIIISERLHEGTKLFLLVVSGRPARIHKNGGTDDCGQYLWFLKLPLVYVEHNQ